MKPVAFVLGIAAFIPAVAQAQMPIAPAAATPAAEAAPATAPGPAPASPVAAGQTPTGPAPTPPGEEYFVEQAPAGAPNSAAAPEPPFEPPPPDGLALPEPPPPEPRHLAPVNSLWLGARVGWFVPFGNVWARAEPVAAPGSGYLLRGIPWSDYASSGPMFELDAGLRLGRSYVAFALWERTQLGSGNLDSGADGPQDGAESDFVALGLRATSGPDKLGFITEVAVGFRRARTFFKNDVQYQFTDAPFEARLGLGGEYRLSSVTSVSSLLTVGVGGFGSAEKVAPNGAALSLTRSIDESDGHAWAALTIAGHFDVIRSAK